MYSSMLCMLRAPDYQITVLPKGTQLSDHTEQASLRSFAMQHITGGATSSAHTGKGTASWGLSATCRRRQVARRLVTGGRWNNPCFRDQRRRSGSS